MKLKSKLFLFYITLFLSVIFIDFFSKYLIRSTFNLGESLLLFNNFGLSFKLQRVDNFGAAWGLFNNHKYFLIIARFLVIIFITILFFRIKTDNSENLKKDLFRKVILLLIISGAIANFTEQLFYGYVIDMLSISFFSYEHPTFNFADIIISLSILLYLIIPEKIFYKNQNFVNKS